MMDFNEVCPHYEAAFEVLGKRWSGLIITALLERPRRFSEITGFVDGLSDRVLSQRLAELEEAGLLERRVDGSKRPVLIEYSITEKGAGLRDAFGELQKWADRWMEVATPAPSPASSGT